jgi:hypothetical protein
MFVEVLRSLSVHRSSDRAMAARRLLQSVQLTTSIMQEVPQVVSALALRACLRGPLTQLRLSFVR